MSKRSTADDVLVLALLLAYLLTKLLRAPDWIFDAVAVAALVYIVSKIIVGLRKGS